MEGYEDLPSKKSSKSDLGDYDDIPEKKSSSIKPTEILAEAQQKLAKSPAGRAAETFQPVKAITEEGIVPQLYQYGKRKVTGEPAPKEQMPPEKPMDLKQTLGKMADFAKKDPGAFAGAIANAVVADPEFLLMPQFLPAKVISSMGKVGKVADAATTAAAQAAGQSAARQLNERGEIDMKVLRQEAQNAAVMASGARGMGEAARAAFPGVTAAPEATRKMLTRAKKEGYTLPASELSPLGSVIEKFYKTPLKERNTETFMRQITEPTGHPTKQVNTSTLPKIGEKLGNEVENILANEQVYVPSTYLTTIQQYVTPQKGTIDRAISSIQYDLPLTGKTWHEVRMNLNKKANDYARSGDTVTASDIFRVIDDWDNFAASNLSGKAMQDFNKWKSSYTAYRDIYDAVLSNKTAYDRYLKGELNPEDLMSSIRKRREGEALSPFTGRPQTKAAALGSGLDLLGYKEPVPYNFLTTLPKVAAGAAAKPVQSFMYSKPGQELLYKGLGQTGLAPYIGSVPEKVAKKEK